MEVAYEYTRKQSEFGKHVVFENGETQVIESILPTDAFDDSYVQQKTVTTGTDTTPPLSTTEVNTERVVYKSTSMQQSEGGFPKEVDPSKPSNVARFRKRVEKSEEFEYAMKLLVPHVEKCLLQKQHC
jgi:dynein intermediate chain 2